MATSFKGRHLHIINTTNHCRTTKIQFHDIVNKDFQYLLQRGIFKVTLRFLITQ